MARSISRRFGVTVSPYLKAIVLDCDGVLLESVGAKTEAYRSLFAQYPEHLEEIISYHLAHGGVSRFEKIAYVYHEILEQQLPQKQLQQLCSRFAALSLDRVLDAPLVKGVLPFLARYYRELRLFVASGTPQEELEMVLDHKGLRGYFTGVFGAPMTKTEILRKILSGWGLTPAEVIMVGDAATDLEAAQSIGIRFIARITQENLGVMQGNHLERIDDLEGLISVVQACSGNLLIGMEKACQ